ncbi:MAG: HAD family hydrolase [Bacteroidetes bacterium]|jgi:HAD superfamily hydrolase (TIGR01509 family)|nr:HAD family hydrolase [Bacteroidota bacterium]
MTTFSAFVFDMDGTITNTNRLIFDSFNHIVQRYRGGTMSDREIAALFGPPEEGALRAIVGDDQLDEAMERYLAFYKGHHRELASVYEGIPALLEELHQRGVALAVFTGKGRHTTDITLDVLGLTHYFRKVVTGNDVVKHKPSGEGIQSIMRDLGLEPSRTVMVGDSAADILAAKEAGVPVASVLWDAFNRDRALQLQRDFTFHSVEDFSAWARSVATPSA